MANLTKANAKRIARKTAETEFPGCRVTGLKIRSSAKSLKTVRVALSYGAGVQYVIIVVYEDGNSAVA